MSAEGELTSRNEELAVKVIEKVATRHNDGDVIRPWVWAAVIDALEALSNEECDYFDLEDIADKIRFMVGCTECGLLLGHKMDCTQARTGSKAVDLTIHDGGTIKPPLKRDGNDTVSIRIERKS